LARCHGQTGRPDGGRCSACRTCRRAQWRCAVRVAGRPGRRLNGANCPCAAKHPSGATRTGRWHRSCVRSCLLARSPGRGPRGFHHGPWRRRYRPRRRGQRRACRCPLACSPRSCSSTQSRACQGTT